MRQYISFSGHKAPVYAVVPGTTPGTFLSADGDGAVVQWNVHEPDRGRQVLHAGQAVFSLHPCAATGHLWVGTGNGTLIVADLKAMQEVTRMDPHRHGIFAFADLPHGLIGSVGGDGVLCLFTSDEHQLVRQIPLAGTKLRTMAMHRDGRVLAVGDNDGCIHILETTMYNTVQTTQAHPVTTGSSERTTGCSALAYHPAKPVLVSGGKDGALRVWRMDHDQQPVLAIPAHQGAIYRIVFSPDGQRMATASRDKSCVVWDANSLDPLVRLDKEHDGHRHSVNSAIWLEGLLITAGEDRRLLGWTE